MATQAQASPGDRQWYIVGRWQEYEGEARANLLRIAAIGVFYIIQLLSYHVFTMPDEAAASFQQARTFHQAATALAVAGSLISLAILLCLRRRIFPASLKYLSTVSDVLLVTALATLGTGPKSPLVAVYFLVIAMAGLRFSVRLVWCATGCAMLGYLMLVGIKDDTWFDPQHFVDPVEQIMTLASLALTGIVLGQVVRRVRGLADEYSRRLAVAAETGS